MTAERIPSFAEATRLAQDRLRANARLSRGHAGMTVDHAAPTVDCACGGHHQRPAYDVDAFRSLAQDAASLLNDVAALSERVAAPRRATVDAPAQIEGGITASERQAVANHTTAIVDRALVTKVASPLAAMNRRNAEVWGGLTPLGHPRAGGSR